MTIVTVECRVSVPAAEPPRPTA